ncbi:MAG: histidinol-phosphate transaminase [Actinomycetaceae bacterium]|nr:histidinol-phosphate transaminase [Actinomycetaceae bacterium]
MTADATPSEMEMPVRIRPNVAALPAYVAGKTKASPRAVKLSSNENPNPTLATIVNAIEARARGVNRYPDMYGIPLVEALSERFEVPADRVVVGNGSVALLFHILATVAGPGDKVVMAWRSFEAYPIGIGTVGAQSVAVPLGAGERHDLAAMLEAANTDPAVTAVLLCTPNNPTGPTLSEAEVRGFLDGLRPGVLVLLDEAYCHFVRDGAAVDGLDLVDDYANLIVLRTFSKAYTLAGLRVGYAVAGDARLASAVRAVSTPFGVNALAEAAAIAALACEDELAGQIEGIVSERERVVGVLREHGWGIPETQGNFFWLPYPGLVDAIVAACAADDITVRPFPEGVRVSIGTPEENDRLLAALLTISVGH